MLSAIFSSAKGAENPLLEPFNTPYNTPPFSKIKNEHYEPAFEQGIKEAREGFQKIVDNPSTPTFENTIEALERNGELLTTVSTIFYNLFYANTNPEMDEIANRIQPKLTELSNDISLNPKIFERVKAVYDNKNSISLSKEQSKLLDDTYKGFVRSGALLQGEQKEAYRKISTELSSLSLTFSQNVLSATNEFTLVIPLSDRAKIEYMPSFVVDAMAKDAKEAGVEGWMVTLQGPSMSPFMMYSKERDLKEKVWRAYNTRCIGGDADNTANVKRIAQLRLELAKLMGYKNYADFALENRMAENATNVNDLLNQLLDASKGAAQEEYNTIKAFAMSDPEFKGADFMPWDWGYYSEKYKAQKYNLNEEELKPYFKLEDARDAIFMLSERLFGLKFVPNNKIDVYDPEVTAYEVYDHKGEFLSIFYMDMFPRKNKKGGAWMNTLRDMYTTVDGKHIRPLVINCCNFTKPTDTAPSLLTPYEVTTMLHEFGHALHGMFAQGSYSSLTGTAVYRDFVELPSQIMENWATEKEWLDLWAKHYQTGEKMPQELIDRLVAAKNYLTAYACVRQLTFGLNDMAWHTITSPVEQSVEEFEKSAVARTALYPPIGGIAFSPAFSHIFSGGYAAGYYSYKWAEVLEADAFSVFSKNGIFDKETAASFRDNILTKGGTEHPMELYIRFRGQKPDVNALIEKMGIKKN